MHPCWWYVHLQHFAFASAVSESDTTLFEPTTACSMTYEYNVSVNDMCIINASIHDTYAGDKTMIDGDLGVMEPF
jgi:hypothetical protein